MPVQTAALDHGAALIAQGRFNEAIALLRRHAELYPHEVTSWVALANAFAVSSHANAAVIAYDAALRIAPSNVPALCGKARVLQSRSEVAAAEALFHQALQVSPQSAEALLGLAKLAVEAGDWATAEMWADALAPTSADIEQAWLRARISLGRRDFDAAERRLQLLLSAFQLAPLQRADALLMLNAAMEGLARYDEAFTAAAKGKALQRQVYAERAAGRESEPVKLQRLARWFETCDPAPWTLRPPQPHQPLDDTAPKHVFLLGFPRSGTTLLEQALAGHPEVETLEEAPTLAEPYAEFLTTPEGLQRLSTLSGAELEAWRARYWQDVKTFGIRMATRVFIDKNPAGTLYMPLIAKLFPDARVLFALRDPRDVVASCFRNNFQINAMTYAFTSLEGAADCYDACMGMAEVYRRVLPLNLMEVRYEALVGDFDRELAAVCRFIGVEMRPGMADIAATTRSRAVRTPSAAQLRQGLNAEGLQRWRCFADHLAPILPRLEPWIRRFGYAGAAP